MIYEEETFDLNGKTITLRSPKKEDSKMLLDWLKTVCDETPFLLQYGDEVKLTIEQEEAFIETRNTSDSGLMILAFVDGEFAGNCSFDSVGPSRRSKHRADIGIALYQKNTGAGLGRQMLTRLLKRIKDEGFEQAELTCIEGNDRAFHLYESLGFKEIGRIPNANKYDDGSVRDDILMVKDL